MKWLKRLFTPSQSKISMVFGSVKTHTQEPWVKLSPETEWASTLAIYDDVDFAMSLGAMYVVLDYLENEEGRIESQYREIDGRQRRYVRVKATK
ncbi:MAG TPA: hypothetical protein VNH19_05725 [Candidatus Limnocylindrales bacterium]|nr:hypothetical protein [Candidatus Limnocylindrales bacterium]